MSDALLRYVPMVPTFRPSAEAAHAGELFLRSAMLNAECLTARFFESVTFIDAGSNWEGVACSACGAAADEWWGEAMSEAAEAGFASLNVRARCCGEEVSLNELRYGWPVAFASFCLEVRNPGLQGLAPEQLQELRTKLGCEVREIKAHV